MASLIDYAQAANNSKYIHYSLKDIILRTSDASLSFQQEKGNFLPGNNGPWQTLETPTRNTSHWLITLAKAYELSKAEKYKNAVHSAADYLLSPELRPYGHTYKIMEEASGCSWPTNGIVGQAWVLEALVTAYNILQKDCLLKTAEELVNKHHLDNYIKLWRITNLNGIPQQIHSTLNQQCWFNALAHLVGMLSNNRKILNKTYDCANNFVNVIKFNEKFMHMKVKISIFLPRHFKDAYKLFKTVNKNKYNMALLSKGYIAYTLYPLAIMHQYDKNLPLFSNHKMIKIINNSINYMQEFVYSYTSFDNPYAFTYHPTGFQMAYITEVFSDICDNITITPDEWLNKQFLNYFNANEMLMNNKTVDKNTFAARFYEVTRLKNFDTVIKLVFNNQ